MVKKQTVTAKNQQRFVILTIFIFLVEVLASFIFIVQNDFLRYASEGLLLVTITTSLLPALLFVLAFAFMKKATFLRRLTQAIVWTFGGMLINVLATLVWYIPSTTNYGMDLEQQLYGPAIITIILYAIGLVIYRRSSAKTKKLLVPVWFEKLFILLGVAFIVSSVLLIIRDINLYGPLSDTYMLYSLVPLTMLVVLPAIGFCTLRIIKNRISRLYTAVFGVSFALYVGTGLSQFANVAQPGRDIQDFLSIGSYVVTVTVYLILLKRVYNRVRANEKL